MEANTDELNAKFCLEETVQETKQRPASHYWTRPSEKNSNTVEQPAYLQLGSLRARGSSVQGRASQVSQHLSVKSLAMEEDKDMWV